MSNIDYSLKTHLHCAAGPFCDYIAHLISYSYQINFNCTCTGIMHRLVIASPLFKSAARIHTRHPCENHVEWC